MTRRAQFPILALLAAALFLRALVPAGWMPAPGAGAFAIEPCPAALLEPMVKMTTGEGKMVGHHDSHKGHSDGDACFSALLIGFAPVDESTLPPARMVIGETPAIASAAPSLKTGPPAPPPPATGPPAIA